MKKVQDVLGVKGHQVWTIDGSASVFDALQLMAEKEIGALVVVERGKIVGIMSERDYARKVILLGRSSPTTPVSDIMTTRVAYAQPEQNIEECMAIMTEKRIRHLPVLDREQLIGIISIGDLVKAIITEQKFMIEQLERYIAG
jgi:CBS domain-containing protein